MKQQALKFKPEVDEPYMSERQLDYFKNLLVDWLNKVSLENGQYAQQIYRETSRAPDLLDESVEVMNRNMALLNGQRSRQIMRQINAALKRIEDGSYGYCLSSGEEIGLQRLLAWPVATLSVEAQELHERRTRQFQQG